MNTSGDDARRALVELVRSSGRDVLATLTRWTGDLALAEDALQDATVKALEVWPREGTPENPVAWIRLSARRRAVDLVRRESARRPKEISAVDVGGGLVDLPDGGGGDLSSSVVHDDLLRLVFTCCHPSLAPETQVALALHTLCGLTNAEVARALLVSEATMAKRLTRARQKIKQACIPYRVPADHELPDRWAAVLATTYLLFNEGYAATQGPALVRAELVDRAIELTRMLARLQPDDAGALGLLALMLIQDSRRAARSSGGALVLLPDQDRSLWDAGKIDEAVRLTGEGLRRSADRANRYVVQAAIAACHALAPTWEATDWDALVSWYDVMCTIDDGPVVRLNRAVALGERDGPSAALAEVDAIEGLSSYGMWHATRGVLLRRLGRESQAAEADRVAARLPLNDYQRRLVGDDSVR